MISHASLSEMLEVGQRARLKAGLRASGGGGHNALGLAISLKGC